MPSFYCPELSNSSSTVLLSGDEFHHLKNVLRHNPGDEIKLNSGKGYFGNGIIETMSKREVIINVISCDYSAPLTPSFAIAFALLRHKNDEWLVEKVTELGAKDLFPITTEYSVRHSSSNTVSRFRQAAIRAIKQCDNPWLPEIHEVLPLIKMLQKVKAEGYDMITASENRPEICLNTIYKGQNCSFLIGPEGGFSEDEFWLLRENSIIEITLSPLILRAETAAISAAAQFNLLRNS